MVKNSLNTMGSGCSCYHSHPKGSPPEKYGLPFLGTAISFANSPINFIQMNTEQLGCVWQTQIVNQQAGI